MINFHLEIITQRQQPMDGDRSFNACEICVDLYVGVWNSSRNHALQGYTHSEQVDM